MKRSLSFRMRTRCQLTGELIDVLVIFFGRSTPDINVLDDEIQNSLKTPEPIPDAIALVFYGDQAARISETWEKNPARAKTLMDRGKTDMLAHLKELAVWKFSVGKFTKAHRSNESHQNFELDMGRLINDCLARLVDERGAYQEAPPGHLFRHPSKRETKKFLLASQLLEDEVDAYFVALAIASAAWERLKDTSLVHIDTMGIYPIARALEEVVCNAGGAYPSTPWEIDSFHSHNGISGLHRVVGPNEAVLVSASTSGTMAVKLADSGVSGDALITLLDMTSDARKGIVVYARDHHHKISPQISDQHQRETVIELTGEYFSARGKKPRAFTLAKKHQSGSLSIFLKHFSKTDTLKLNGSRASGKQALDVVSLNEIAVAENADFMKWVEDEIRWKTPISVTHVLPVPGPGGRAMATVCLSAIAARSGVTAKLVMPEDMQQLAQGNDVGGVLVCAPIVGNGHGLRSLARDLRELVPKATRHFIAGVGLPETEEAWKRLAQFLTESGDKSLPYQFSCWAWISTGAVPGLGQAWRSASQLMQKTEQLAVSSDAPWNVEHIQKSLQLVGDALESNANSFLPGSRGVPLKLTRGFVYWNPDLKDFNECDHAAVSFAAMTSALQNAREFSDPLVKLASTVHETVVLDAENFLRFNDGVLQASLLRAAQPYELDYSRAPELSEVLREFLEKVFINHSMNYGEAAPEFALALATGRLRLTDVDKKQLIKKLQPVFTEPSVLLGLMYCWSTG